MNRPTPRVALNEESRIELYSKFAKICDDICEEDVKAGIVAYNHKWSIHTKNYDTMSSVSFSEGEMQEFCDMVVNLTDDGANLYDAITLAIMISKNRFKYIPTF